MFEAEDNKALIPQPPASVAMLRDGTVVDLPQKYRDAAVKLGPNFIDRVIEQVVSERKERPGKRRRRKRLRH